MRLFGKIQPAEPALNYKLVEIRLGDSLEQSSVMIGLLDEIWQANRSLPRSRLSGSLPAYTGLEVQAKQSGLRYYLWLAEPVIEIITNQLMLTFPGFSLTEPPDDYSTSINPNMPACVGELDLTNDELIPVLAPIEFRQSNRWPTIHNFISQVKDDDQAWLQVLIRPTANDWKTKIDKQVKKNLRAGRDQLNQALLAKARSNGFRTKIRLVYLSRDKQNARSNLQTFAQTFTHLNSFAPNGFRLKSHGLSRERQLEFQARLFIDKGYLLNTDELSSTFGFGPSESVIMKTHHEQPPKGLSRFEKLLAEAEAKSDAPSPKTTKLERKHESKTSRRQPRGVLEIATKSNAKKVIGKVATSKSQAADQTGEVTIKLH